MSSSMRVLIGGGSGFIGRHLRSALQGRGHDVTVISRTTGPGRITWSELESNARLPACDAVVNVSGENILQPGRRWTKKFQADVRSSRIDTSKLLVKLMTESEEKPKEKSANAKSEVPFTKKVQRVPFHNKFATSSPTARLRREIKPGFS